MKKRTFVIYILTGIIFIVLFKYKKLSLRFRKHKASKKLKKYIKIAAHTKDTLELAASYYMIGNIYAFELDDYNSAIEYYNKILDSDVRNYLEDSALYNLARCYKALNQNEKSRRILLKIIEKYPESARAKDAELELSRA